MSENPINLVLRFFLELAALVALGYWGWVSGAGFTRFVLAIGLPILAATIWGVFRVPGDTSASGRALVPVPGAIRLGIEMAFFSCAVWGAFASGWSTVAAALAILVLLHYLVSYDRVFWLMRR